MLKQRLEILKVGVIFNLLEMKKFCLIIVCSLFVLNSHAKGETKELILNEKLIFHTEQFNEPSLMTNHLRSQNSSLYLVSLKCWLFRKWVVRQLEKVSNNDRLIDETANELKKLCEIANDWGLI